MKNFYLGNVVRRLRKQKGFTLDALSEGICSKRQLQRIETNLTIPSASLLTKLSKKLNENILEYLPYCTYEDPIKTHDVITEFQTAYDTRELKKLHELTIPYYEKLDNYSPAFQQIVGYFYGASLLNTKTSTTLNTEYYERLLRISIDFSNHEELCEQFRTQIESKLIFSLISIEYFGDVLPINAMDHMDRISQGIELLKKLIHSYTCCYKELDYNFLGRIYNNIGHAYFLVGQYDEGLLFIDKGLSICNKNTNLFILSMLYYVKGNFLIQLGQINEAKKCYRYFIILHDILDKTDYVESISNHLKKTYEL
ncbi:MAG: helix-turn-helix domain-containing protein [Turicibacter sp.]